MATAPDTPAAPVTWVTSPTVAAPTTGWVAPPPLPPTSPASALTKIAAALLLFMGGITTLVGVFFVLGAAILTRAANQQGVPGLGTVVGGTLAVIAVVVLVIGIVEMLGGVGVWRGSGWGRVVGLIYGVLGLLLGLAVTLDAASATSGTRDGGFGGIVFLAVYGFVTLVLAMGWRASPA